MPIVSTRAAPALPPSRPMSGKASNALAAGVVAAPFPVLDPASASAAMTAFAASCPSLLKREDLSGLTRTDDWRPACAAAPRSGDARAFFADNFAAVQVGDGAAFATGYYEPEIAGSRARAPGYDVPIYRRPPELREIDLGAFSDAYKGKKLWGRVVDDTFAPFPDRAAIDDGALAGRDLELAWGADQVEVFFLEVQGSGRLRLPDGGVMRIGYAAQNGRDYVGIGARLRDRGLIQPGQLSMQGVMAWLRANPEAGRAVMRENRSVVFFRELTDGGPVGALGVTVTPRVTVAADPAFVPLGAPIALSMDRADASGLWIAQDTGGAIKGANRVDTFWGAGDAARTTAGGMSARGTAVLLLPRAAIARLVADAPSPAER